MSVPVSRTLVATLLVGLVACGRNPRPPAATPASAPAAMPRQAAADSAALAARSDSARAAARADSAAALARRERARADSVRAQVQQGGSDPRRGVVASGLDDRTMAELEDRIHFDFDKSDIRTPDRVLLDRKLEILRRNPRLEIEIGGHCDERGSDEYNLALGLRRAAAAKRYLVDRGIAEARISIVSHGEERPLDPGHNEAAWATNRRAEFALTRSAR